MDLKIGSGGEIALPDEVRKRYGLNKDTSLRLIETRNAILLVPLTGAVTGSTLERELADWQALGQESWDLFAYEEDVCKRRPFHNCQPSCSFP